MEFFPRKKKNPPAIIVVALIDVLLVVLIFLLVTTTFKQQPALTLALPDSSQAQVRNTADLAPIYITLSQEGEIFLGASEEPITSEMLQSRLSGLVRENPKVRIALNMDKGAPVGSFVSIVDAARGAGVNEGLIINTRQKE